jgi:hypothetical protein
LSRGAPSKRFLDIEKALHWAYRDELPKRQRGGSWIGGTTLSPIREPIDRDPNDHPKPGFPGEPHPDAFLIEAAVKGLDGWFGHGFGPDPTAAGLMHGMEHMEVDHLQAGVEAVAAMAAIVAVHARTGTRPALLQELPRRVAHDPRRPRAGILRLCSVIPQTAHLLPYLAST